MCHSEWRCLPRVPKWGRHFRLPRRWPVLVSAFVNPGDLVRFLPEIILTIMGTLLMVLDPIINRKASNLFGTLSLLGLIAALFGAVAAYSQPGPAFGGLLIVDGFATFF